MKCSPGISNFLEEISSLSHSIVFLISLHWSMRKAFLSLLAILWNSEFKWIYLSFPPLPLASLLFWAICKALSNIHFAFLRFFSLGMILITASCTMPRTSARSSSGTLSDLIPWISLSFLLCNRKRFHYDISEWSSGFPYFLQFKSEFVNKAFMIWATVSSWSCFCWLYRASPSLAAKNIINLISVLTIRSSITSDTQMTPSLWQKVKKN